MGPFPLGGTEHSRATPLKPARWAADSSSFMATTPAKQETDERE
jgi:hypothetical protein